ncbi:hypothetical protein psyc5s11_06890 [Clostridium gelidum]|uniref:AAA family ATPase n=2 Tax=Clostridium gelidum TaxID=704125 RepID=A0ABM7T0D9_9CLOT|nr:hypothetical protein psyc5s11_06890 [Clostridium gelidum]
MHYMVDIGDKINKISNMVHKGEYFVINRPRQYGKTTTMYMLEEHLKEEYLVFSISFEGIGDEIFRDEINFAHKFLKILSRAIRFSHKEMSEFILELAKETTDILDLSDAITEIVEKSEKEIIILIDEVDKSSNNQLFLNFLGMLRSKYLLRAQGKDFTFHSVILAGVYDVKNLKLKLRQDEEKKYNSPWNIAVNFNVDMSFSSVEIESMLKDYCLLENVEMNIREISEKLYYYTTGYPFLVSRICQIIDEEILLGENKRLWNEEDIIKAVKKLLIEKNTLFDDLIKNIENNTELGSYIFELMINGEDKTFNIHNPIIDLGVIFGYFRNIDGRVRIANGIYEQTLYNYYSSKLENKIDMTNYNFKDNFITKTGLDFEKVLLRFQQFMKEEYSNLDSKFIEREGRLLFLAFIKPIINGIGFDFKEVQISEEKRLDIVITYLKNKYLVELKIWRGEEYHQKGLKQLSDYLDNQELKVGYLLIYNFNKNKEYKNGKIMFEGKEIFIAWV